ncbi:hypothetical protein G7Z17_g3134 [Cylindrodendrum hubeiense]|uniref:Protein kinase domain-containing protein n=1 Tax=Cylindrodendrum hubeiense TaxID=595255 RepID=A0A9P5HD07_9HYPO|nr:hypothetical protein G7Z17_g3134 [Cylindrodendrum hubeiense]
MSDPLGVTASVIAVLQLAATATQYLRDVKNGSADRMRLRDELRSSVCLLEMLKDRLEDDADTTLSTESLKPSSIQSLINSGGPLGLFKRVLEEIIAKLAPQDRLRRFSQPFTWPFDKKDISELLASLERLKSLFNLVLQNNLVDLVKFANLKLDDLSDKVENSETRARESELEQARQDWYPWFLLAKLHVESLSRKFNRKEAPDAVEVAESVLFWVIFAQRALTVLELQHMYAVRELSEDSPLEEDDLPDAEILTSVCGGLIIVDAESQTVRPVHYTAQQYFEKYHEEARDAARISLAKGSDFHRFDTDCVWPDFQAFFTNPVALQVANQTWNLETAHYGNWSQEYPRNVPALVLAAVFNLPSVLRQMVSDGHDTEGRGSDKETALIRSASFGHTENVQILLELGASVNERDYMQQTALQRAAKSGKESVVRVLLDGAADVNMRASSDWTALMSAVSSGHIEIVRILVKAGADLMAETVWGDSALSIATRSGQEAIATLLADSGAILPRGLAGHRASVVASQKGLHQLVRRLTSLAPDYESVAQRPLERQVSRMMGGLSEAQMAAADVSGQQPGTLSSRPGVDDSDFLDVMEGFNYNMGFSKRYCAGERLGKGHYAEVLLCSNRVTDVKYAVKAFSVDGWKNSLKILSMRREVKAMQELQKKSHPNILRLVDIFAEYSDNKIYMVLEIAPEGELFNYIVMKQKLSEEDARKLFLQLFSAVEFLLADFGLAKKINVEPGIWELTTTLCGTPSYVAPEMLVESKQRQYGFPVDIWSCGVVLYICLCGFPPFSDELYSKEFPYTLSQQIKLGRFDYPSPYWDSVDDPALDLIDGMLITDMALRFDIKQCLDHPWTLEKAIPILPDTVQTTNSKPTADPSSCNGGERAPANPNIVTIHDLNTHSKVAAQPNQDQSV